MRGVAAKKVVGETSECASDEAPNEARWKPPALGNEEEEEENMRLTTYGRKPGINAATKVRLVAADWLVRAWPRPLGRELVDGPSWRFRRQRRRQQCVSWRPTNWWRRSRCLK